MAKDREPLVNFNIATMSGIYPGSRTMIYQRLRLRQINGANEAANVHWTQLQWYAEPASAILLQTNEEQPATKPLLAISEPEQPNFVQRLHEGLSEVNLKADACFACRNWQPLSVHTDDGLPAGRCRWNDDEGAIPSAIATQSALSLACQHFQPLNQPQSSPVTTTSPSTIHPRVLKSAELDPDRLPFWPRLWHRMRHSLRHHLQAGQRPLQNWTEQVIERSGVGAGTEPCFICQGRLANLGALAVASPEGDKQTLSVWRCRSCYTTYFNDWTDRWERLDNLETEESYYRIAPAEAYAILNIIHATAGGDHPGRRHERRQQREQILAMLSGNQPLSHQVRQGR